ncbi:MAG TPA: glycosyltransferase 87 family protein [Acidimicrobiales bacterium]|nr:glycosyltransferase 87 family protein [Acidimicrobiales bacterium]
MLLAAVFVATRLAVAWLADHPEHYRSGSVAATGDVRLYERWATEVARNDRAAYGEVRIEYPPGSLPFVLAPLTGTEGDDYRTRFIALMVLVDAAGLLGLLVMARRAGSWWGPWAWTLLVPLLGPVAYLRLDLVPAVATIWALERAQAGGWWGVGGLMGFGTLAKVYPALLLPVAVASRGGWRWRPLVAAAGVVVVGVLPFTGSLDGLWESVVGYHSERGVQVESTWGAALLIAGHLDPPVKVVFDRGAAHLARSGGSALERVSLVLSVAVVVAGAALARKRVEPGSSTQLVMVMTGTLALLLAVGTVFSPQFMLWLSALAAVLASLAGRVLWVPLGLIAIANVLSQVLFPFRYAGLLANDAAPVALLVTRNALVAVVGLVVLAQVWRGEAAPRNPDPASAT